MSRDNALDALAAVAMAWTVQEAVKPANMEQEPLLAGAAAAAAAVLCALATMRVWHRLTGDDEDEPPSLDEDGDPAAAGPPWRREAGPPPPCAAPAFTAQRTVYRVVRRTQLRLGHRLTSATTGVLEPDQLVVGLQEKCSSGTAGPVRIRVQVGRLSDVGGAGAAGADGAADAAVGLTAPALGWLSRTASTGERILCELSGVEAAGAWQWRALRALQLGEGLDAAVEAFGRCWEAHRAAPEYASKVQSVATRAKLRHDAEQLEWLVAQSLLPSRCRKAADALRTVEAVLFSGGEGSMVRLLPGLRRSLQGWYCAPLYIAPAAAIRGGALNPGLDWAAAAQRFGEPASGPGFVVIDNLLRPEALQTLTNFCVASTVFTEFRFKGPYVGTRLETGLGNALVLQIAAELRTHLEPLLRVAANSSGAGAAAAAAAIEDGLALRAGWAYKYLPEIDGGARASAHDDGTGVGLHADDAAINVNLWVSDWVDADANDTDSETGGLQLWLAEAPLDWDFKKFNQRPSKLRDWLDQQDQGGQPVPTVRVAHRRNRCVIFNSNLVHKSDMATQKQHAGIQAVSFANRRINCTLLFGERRRRPPPPLSTPQQAAATGAAGPHDQHK